MARGNRETREGPQIANERAGTLLRPVCMVWTADFLPNDATGFVEPMIEAGMDAMKSTRDGSTR